MSTINMTQYWADAVQDVLEMVNKPKDNKMTDAEKQTWFELVKGKKIRWSGNQYHYFIPRKKTSNFEISGELFLLDSTDPKTILSTHIRTMHIDQGFNGIGNKWEWFEKDTMVSTDSTQTLINKTVDFSDIRSTGAKLLTPENQSNSAYCSCTNSNSTEMKYLTFTFNSCNSCKKEVK